jgi:hypothetical protein
MRCLLVLSLLSVAAAGEPTQKEQGQCLVDSGEAVSDALDASLFVWASYKRCGLAGQATKCAIDVSSAVKATNSMINIILKVVNKCHGLNTANKKCGLAASQFTEHTAGLSAAAAQVYQKCPAIAAAKAQGLGVIASPVMCTIDIKNSAKGLFKTVTSAQKNKNECATKGLDCDKNILDITASVAGMGSFIAGAVGQCRRTAQFGGNSTTDTRYSVCTQATTALIEYLMEVSKDGITLAQKCTPAAAEAEETPDTVMVMQRVGRLYEEDQKQAYAGNTLNLFLGAFLPVTAIAGFVGGRIYANRREQYEQTREIMSDHE